VSGIKPPYGTQTAIGAIRLAITGAASDEVAMKFIKAILDNTEVSPGNATEPMQALLREFQLIGGRFEVTS